MREWIRNILIAALLVISLLTAATWLKIYLEQASPAASLQSDTIYISNYSVGSIQKMEIENEYGLLTLIYENEIWYAEGYKDKELDQEVVNELTYALTHITGESIVSEEEDETNLYGMLTPSAKITTHHDGALQQSFIIGDKAPMADEYYMQSSVFKKVFTVDKAYYVYGQIKLEDLLELNSVQLSNADIKKIEIVSRIEGYVQSYTIQPTAQDNDISLCYWEFVEPFSHDIDTAVMYGTDDFEGLITNLTEVSGERIVGSIQEDAAGFGLETPVYEISIYGAAGEYERLLFGDYGDKDYFALEFKGDENIYIIEKDSVPFVYYSAYMLADANLCLINLDSVASIEINLPGISDYMNISHTVVLLADGSEGTSVSVEMQNIDEAFINSSDFDEQKIWFYEDIAAIKIDGIIFDGEIEGESAGYMGFSLNSKIRDSYTVEFYEYSQSHYIAKKNGESAGYLINKNEIDKLAESYVLLMQGALVR